MEFYINEARGRGKIGLTSWKKSVTGNGSTGGFAISGTAKLHIRLPKVPRHALIRIWTQKGLRESHGHEVLLARRT